MQTPSIKRPTLGLYLSEGFRAINEKVQSIQFRKTYRPKEVVQGHPILVIPGFLTNDVSCKPLRIFLDRIGYVTYPWGLGRNFAKLEDLKILEATIDTIYKRHQCKMSLIGWSLGGVYARELAKVKPELVSQVITLGSPFAGIQEPNNAAWIYNILKGKKAKEVNQEWMNNLPNPAPVPTLALYSKTDGIVPYQVCMELKEDTTHKNKEVKSSHLGMGFNKEVLQVIAKQLPNYAKKEKTQATLMARS